MDVFDFRDGLVADYADYDKSFIRIRDGIRGEVEERLRRGSLWFEPLLQLNPSYAPGAVLDDLVKASTLREQRGRVFRAGKADDDPIGNPMRLHCLKGEAMEVARGGGHDYVVTTGTGSGKGLTYISLIVDHVLGSGETAEIVVKRFNWSCKGASVS